MNEIGSPRLTAVTLGVRDVPASARFYEAMGFVRKFRATGDEIAFVDAGGVVLALWDRDKLAADTALAAAGTTPDRFRDVTLAWNCATAAQVDAAFQRALDAGQGRCGGRSRPTTAATAAISPIQTATPGRWCRRRALRSPKTAG